MKTVIEVQKFRKAVNIIVTTMNTEKKNIRGGPHQDTAVFSSMTYSESWCNGLLTVIFDKLRICLSFLESQSFQMKIRSNKCGKAKRKQLISERVLQMDKNIKYNDENCIYLST